MSQPPPGPSGPQSGTPVWVVPAPPRHLPAVEEPSRRVVRIELLVLFFAAAAPNLVFGLSGITDPQTVQTDVAVLTLIASMLASLGPAAVAVYLLWRDGFLRAAGFGKPRPVALLGQSALGFVCCVGAVMIVGVIITVLRGLPEDGTSVATDGDRPDLTLGYLLVALAISATAGLGEEVIYRGYGISRMEQAGWPRAALFVPTAVWTAQHLYAGPIALLVVGAVGVPLVWLFWWKRSIWPLVIAHALYDVFVFLINTQR